MLFSYPTVSDGILIALDLFFKFGLGYGVRARRTVGTSLVVITLFALVYWVVSGCCPTWGYIVKDERTVWGSKVVRADPQSHEVKKFLPVAECGCLSDLWDSFGPCLYFSVVTFTTLGYGDYIPEGGLRYVAAIEVLLGVILIAFLTAVLARKFVR